jgi:putative membrane protein
MVIIFEVGVRLDGGLNTFMKTSTVDYNFMAILMVIHIIIAVVTVVLWSIILYGAIKKFKVEKVNVDHNHKFFGKIVFLGMSITSVLGISIYYLLFIM